MKTLPTQERALRKRSALISAAINEFSNDGFEVATAKSIAAAANVATGTFYQYFDNKNDILRVIATRRFESIEQQIQMSDLVEVMGELEPQTSIENQFLSTLKFVYEFHASEPELHQVLEQRRAQDPKLRKIMNDGEAVLRNKVLIFVRTFNLPSAEVISDNLFAMTEGLVHRLVFSEQHAEPDKALAIGAQMLASFFVNKN